MVCQQGGITCGAIDEPRKSSKAIDERVIINFRDKNVVIARFRDKNVVIARFCDKNVVIARFRDKTMYVWGLRYRGTWFPGSRTLCHPAQRQYMSAPDEVEGDNCT